MPLHPLLIIVSTFLLAGCATPSPSFVLGALSAGPTYGVKGQATVFDLEQTLLKKGRVNSDTLLQYSHLLITSLVKPGADGADEIRPAIIEGFALWAKRAKSKNLEALDLQEARLDVLTTFEEAAKIEAWLMTNEDAGELTAGPYLVITDIGGPQPVRLQFYGLRSQEVKDKTDAGLVITRFEFEGMAINGKPLGKYKKKHKSTDEVAPQAVASNTATL